MVKETSKVLGVTSKNNTKMEQGKGHLKKQIQNIQKQHPLKHERSPHDLFKTTPVRNIGQHNVKRL